jgi:hypothetical protein
MSDDETPRNRAHRLKIQGITAEIGKVIQGAVNDAAGPKVGYALYLFDFGGKGSIAYASNANRADMIVAMRELLIKLETSEQAQNIAFRKPGAS